MIVYLIRNTVKRQVLRGQDDSAHVAPLEPAQKAEARSGRSNAPLHRDMRVFQLHCFEVEVLAEARTQRRIAQMERKFIRIFNAVTGGYKNEAVASWGGRTRRTCGSAGRVLSIETKRKIKESNRRTSACEKECRRMLTVMRSEGSYIRTYLGEKFWPLNPKAEEIDIRDIAHALALTCRFTGHCYCFYSVADHSLRVSKLAENMALDAAEESGLPAHDRIVFPRRWRFGACCTMHRRLIYAICRAPSNIPPALGLSTANLRRSLWLPLSHGLN